MKARSAIRLFIAVLFLCTGANTVGHAQGNIILNGNFAGGGGSYTNWTVSWHNLMFNGSG